MASEMKGEFVVQVSTGMDTYSFWQRLGVRCIKLSVAWAEFLYTSLALLRQ